MLSNRMNASFIDYASFGIADPNLRAKCARLQKPENLNNVRILEMIEALQPMGIDKVRSMLQVHGCPMFVQLQTIYRAFLAAVLRSCRQLLLRLCKKSLDLL
jgi:LmbE family N-acetylglucosaminyl deacetylase